MSRPSTIRVLIVLPVSMLAEIKLLTVCFLIPANFNNEQIFGILSIQTKIYKCTIYLWIDARNLFGRFVADWLN